MSDDRISVTGVVASTPNHIVTSEGLHISSFRLASNSRRYDRAAQRWIDADTNWFTVTTFRQLASNIATSITKGERVVVHGRLRVRPWTSGEKSGIQVEIEADAVGHDLSWGTSSFTRTIVRAEQPAANGQSDEFTADGQSEHGEGAAPFERHEPEGNAELPEAWPAANESSQAQHDRAAV